jgi:hypothetical protein
MREQFDWCEDVENDIVMKDKSIAMATGVPIVGTENIAASSTDYATAIEPVFLPLLSRLSLSDFIG